MLWFWLIVFVALIALTEWWRATKEGCGIPVVLYSELVFLNYAIYALISIIILCCVKPAEGSGGAKCAGVVRALSVLIFLGLIVYGYIIYLSPDNDCAENKDTRGWNTFMLVILILGTLFFALVCCLCMCACCFGMGAAAF